MRRERVSSTSIAAIGFDDATETLEVEFVSGGIYRFHAVGRDVFEAFRDAPSKGMFFNEHIKDAYPFERTR
jgi:hypothetical protein